MNDVDQRGFDNQPSGPRPEYLPAKAAAERLGIKLATLYAYASRGLVRSVAGGAGGRARRYAREDLDALRARHDARSGHGPVAGSALRWGEPVLESALTEIAADGLRYRGFDVVALAARGVAFERVAELLWSGTPPDGDAGARDAAWHPTSLGLRAARFAALVPAGTHPLASLALATAALAVRDPARFDTRVASVTARARGLIPRLAASLALPRSATRAKLALTRGQSVADVLARAFPARGGAEAVAALDRTLVLCADHELNVSAFAARVAASGGADVYACVAAALAALSGPLHGGACDRVEALLDEVRTPARAAAVVRERARRGDPLPGFGHRLYPQGDPRAAPLLDAAHAIAPRDPRVRTLRAVCDALEAALGEKPTLDYGLVAIASALGLGPGGAAAVFAIGRSAGWVAHAIEQYQAGFLLRPRARYVGPAPVALL